MLILSYEPSVDIDPIPTGAGGIVRGPTLTITGKAGCIEQIDDTEGPTTEEDSPQSIREVAVRFGSSGVFVQAHPTGPTQQKRWTTWSTDQLPITGVVNDTLLITARVLAPPRTVGGHPDPAPTQRSDTVTVIVDRTPPVLSMNTPDEMTQAVENGKTTFQLAGSARDDRSPVAAVEWMLGQGPQFTPATPKTGGDWSSWTADVEVSPANTYQLLVRARDSEGNITPPQQVTLHAVDPFQTRDPSDVFGQASYLDDLLKFAGQRMVDGDGDSLTPARFAAAYGQNFTNLTKPNNREAATALVHQVRVSVEVLRAYLAGVDKTAPPGEEANYRQRAYAVLLRNLGTSVDEIRRARGDTATRARLAARLGVDRPERLDQLILTAEQVSEGKLEQLFGLQDTTRPRLVRRPQPALLTWQLARLRAQWQEHDNATRVYDDEIPVPIIDPDLLVESDFRTRNKDADPAFALWSARSAEMTTLLKHIDQLRKSKNTPLEGFDAIVGQFVAQVQRLITLLADYRAGNDIGAQLIEIRLDVAAFLHLMRSRDLAADGTILDDDWADVYSIAVQVAKLGRYPVWRDEERANGLALSPDYFVLPDPATLLLELPEWRATLQARRAWQARLQTRINQRQDVIAALRVVVDAAEEETLPQLRDLLAATAGDSARGLLIDLTGGPAQRTTRLAQAIETLQGALFAVRTGAFTANHPAAGWKLARGYAEADFDKDWVFWGSYEAWQGAMRVFIYPESHLLPTLRPGSTSTPTQAYRDLIKKLRQSVRNTPDRARTDAHDYLARLRAEFANDTTFPAELRESPPPPQRPFVLTERLTDNQLAGRQTLSAKLMGTFKSPHQAPNYLAEVFYFVPLLCGLQLQRSGEYVAALDWFQTVYAYHLPPGRLDKLPANTLPPGKPLPDRRHIYYGLTLDEQIPTQFQRPGNWPREGLNAHDIARDRANALTRFTVISLVRCFEQFADAEFTRDTDESVARARALYQTALDMLGLAYPTAVAAQFGPDPVIEALRLHAESHLRKLQLGRNIAGLDRQRSPELATGTAIAPRQPTPYRYTALITRAKDLIQNAAQMEAALLAALEKHDTESYNLLKAHQDVELASANVDLQDLRVKQAGDGIRLALVQQGRAQIQFDHFDGLIQSGVSGLESASMFLGLVGSVVGGAASSDNAAGPLGGLASGLGSVFGQIASQERRDEDWRLQRDLAQRDLLIGRQQIGLALDQFAVATQEQTVAHIQADHAAATIRFLAGKFTSAELYEFMSEVLDGVYRFLLQQATAMTKLAENQLAFERQEAPRGVIQGDYYAAPEGGSDRRGMTGSARLLADIVQLDQHAVLTDRRKLQLTKTLSLARLAPVEFTRFRDIGVLVIGTPQALFDRDFPGHYLRLIKRIRLSLIALIPPTEGIRATLSTPGTSRVVIADDAFRTVVVRRDPETVSLTSPREATGLFELVPDSQPELLLPFEGTGVDTVWRLELPKAANPFDYSTIADILVTVEYTALNNFDYRQQVLQTLDQELSVDRPISLRQQFPDQWYDLSNPDQAATPMTVRFNTTRADFLPNIDDPMVQHLVLYLAPSNGRPVEIQDVRLTYKKSDDGTPVGGSADSVDGLISTRRANGNTWLPITATNPPTGEWQLALPTDDKTKALFRNETIQDILFVITYSGRAPQWPT